MNSLVPKNSLLLRLRVREQWRGLHFLTFVALSFALGGCQYLRELGSDKKATASQHSDSEQVAGVVTPVTPPAAAEFQVGQWSATGMLTRVVEEDVLLAKKAKESAPSGTSSTGVEEVATDPLSIELQVIETGQVVGKVSCGDHQAELSGVFDEEKVRANFSGERMTGTLLAARKDADLLGMVRVSLVERNEVQEEFRAFTADMTLKKK